MRLDSEFLRRDAEAEGRDDIAAWIKGREDAASAAHEREMARPLETPAGVIEAGKVYNVTVRRRANGRPMTYRGVKLNRSVGFSGGLVSAQPKSLYLSARILISVYDKDRITKIEEVTGK